MDSGVTTDRLDESEEVFEVPAPGGTVAQIAASVFTPSAISSNPVVVLAVPGGSYDRTYWNLDVPGHEGYSFARHMTDAGVVVVAMDNLGTGASDRIADPFELTIESLATAVSEVARLVRQRLADGTLVATAPIEHCRLIGVGHSLGSQVLVAAQATEPTFDAIAVLGGSFIGNSAIGIAPDLEVVRAGLKMVAGDSWDSGYVNFPREISRELFHAADVPQAVIDAESLHVTVMPREAAVRGVAGGALAAYPPMISTPVFVAFGDIDTSPDPSSEAGLYSASSKVTPYLVAGSAHCHNSSTNRAQLWDALLTWASSPDGPKT